MKSCKNNAFRFICNGTLKNQDTLVQDAKSKKRAKYWYVLGDQSAVPEIHRKKM